MDWVLFLRRCSLQTVQSIHCLLNVKGHCRSRSFWVAPPQHSQQITVRRVFMRTVFVSAARFQQLARFRHQRVKGGNDALQHRVMGRVGDRDVERWSKRKDRLL